MSIKNLKELASENKELCNLKLLPLCHTLRDIGEFSFFQNSNMKLVPKECDEFIGEKLVYLFYGKAVYTDFKTFGDKFAGFFPFTLIFDYNEIPTPARRAYPFDSGGYSRYNIQDFARSQFEIGAAEPNEIKNLVNKLYNDNSKYQNTKMNIELEKYPFCFQLAALKRLYESYVNKSFNEFAEHAFTF